MALVCPSKALNFFDTRPRNTNIESYKLFQELNENIALQLKPQLFEKISREFSILKIDLFAYRINHHIERYVMETRPPSYSN